MNKSLYVRITEFVTFGVTLILVIFGIVMVEIQQQHLEKDIKNRMAYIGWQLVEHDLYGLPFAQMKQAFIALQQHDHMEMYTLIDALVIKKHTVEPLDGANNFVLHLPDHTYLELIATSEIRTQEMRTLIVNIIIAIALILILFRVIFVAYLKKLFVPLEHLVGFCHAPNLAILKDPLFDTSYEVKELTLALERLMEYNQNLSEQKQHIFKEAAHELKSPLAILKARVSLFKQDKKASKEAFIKETEQDIAHITDKLKELLFLKEIEWDMQQQKVWLPIAAKCHLMQQAYTPIFLKKSLAMQAEIDPSIALFVYKGAFEKLMQTIFENIFFHSKSHSTIVVRFDRAKRMLVIQNSIGDASDATLFSSSIGTKMIERLCQTLGYGYETEIQNGLFITKLTFDYESLEA